MQSLLNHFALSPVNVGPLPQTTASGNEIQLILQIVFMIVGALSLLFITIGGFRYVISQGEPQAVARSKNTILYAIVGLLISIGAEAIVTFVIGKV